MKRRTAIILAVLCLLLPPSLFVAQYLLFVRTAVTPPATVQLTIPAGSSLPRVAELLRGAGVIDGERNFVLLAKLDKANDRIKSGLYEFGRAATPQEVLRRLLAGDVVRRKVTIPEGFTLVDIARRLEQHGFGGSAEILSLCRDRAFLTSLDIAAPTLEGYLFPETYFFAVGTAPRQILQTMVRQYRQRFTPELADAARRHGLSERQLLILASIVQKEAGRDEEMPLIASVFHNRLRLKMPLQADPTVIYGIENFNGNITRRDLLRTTPYNTYRIPGLPAGPIANPGEAALRAAAFPAATRYLYFVARGDGSHAFSESLTAHNAAVRRYQLRRQAG